MQKPEKCVLFINDAPDLPDCGVEAGLKYAEQKGLFIVAHWRTKQRGRYLTPEAVLAKACDYIIRRPEIKHLILVHSDSGIDQEFLLEVLINLTYVNDVSVKELWAMENPRDNPS
jgi:hypothetical protein